MPVKTRLLALIVAAQMTVPAWTQERPAAPPIEIVAGLRSCLMATGPKGFDPSKIEADGWQSASMTAQAGKPLATPLTFFSKGGLLLMFDKSSARPLCFVTAHLANAGTFGDVAYAIDGELAVHGVARPGENNVIYWFPKGHIVQLSMTGTKAAPGIRLSAGYMAQH